MRGPILVLGAGGFIGSSILNHLTDKGSDVIGVINSHGFNWRTAYAHPGARLHAADLFYDLEKVVKRFSPSVIINCAAYGSFSTETDTFRIYRTNFELVHRILHCLPANCVYIHAGTSSEYGLHSVAPLEYSKLTPNSDYAVSKACASTLIEYYGRFKRIRCCNLRLYSVYGPLEASTRLIPQVVASARRKILPKFVDPFISRDFVYIDDVVAAFVRAATAVATNEDMRGEAYNICTGKCTFIHELAELAIQTFNIETYPDYTMEPRAWDHRAEWFGDPTKAQLFWTPRTSLVEGLKKTYEWYAQMNDDQRGYYESKK